MKVYVVMSENLYGDVHRVEGLYTTKAGAKNKIDKLNKKGSKDYYTFSLPIKGNMLEFFAEWGTRICRARGEINQHQSVSFKRMKLVGDK